MDVTNLVKVSFCLSVRQYAEQNRAIRQDALGETAPAITVIICGIFDEAWVPVIDAIAAA